VLRVRVSKLIGLVRCFFVFCRNNLPPALRELLSFNSKGEDEDWDVYKTRERKKPKVFAAGEAKGLLEVGGGFRRPAKRRRTSSKAAEHDKGEAFEVNAVSPPPSVELQHEPDRHTDGAASEGHPAASSSSPPSSTSMIPCDFCERAFKYPWNHRQHVDSAHPNATKEEQKAKTSTGCVPF